MTTEKTLLEEAEENISDLSDIEKDFFAAIEKEGKFSSKVTQDKPDDKLPIIRAVCFNWLFNSTLSH